MSTWGYIPPMSPGNWHCYNTFFVIHVCFQKISIRPDVFLYIIPQKAAGALPVNPADPGQRRMPSQHPGRLAVRQIPRNTMDSLELDRSKGSLLPHAAVSAELAEHVYFFAPVHSREREIGYLVLENCDYLLTHQFLFETLNTFRTSIEALYGKLILRKRKQATFSALHPRFPYRAL